jgi:hypothetical protein
MRYDLDSKIVRFSRRRCATPYSYLSCVWLDSYCRLVIQVPEKPWEVQVYEQAVTPPPRIERPRSNFWYLPK